MGRIWEFAYILEKSTKRRMKKFSLFVVLSLVAAASLFVGATVTPVFAQGNMTMGMDNMSMPMNNMTMGMDNSTGMTMMDNTTMANDGDGGSSEDGDGGSSN
ncbi:exported protein of unknown function [Candidatus Nitrosocosmicus arcticus]|uniref:Uncharacterized protein n=2 Tax=Candidatus Nitrosocosmicus arcticus TaxID=2035267 RepID=A0A557SWL2_9ARCH|nr:exported protein of unknown function [Candidatus Nitrosocosmicus arcticus]